MKILTTLGGLLVLASLSANAYFICSGRALPSWRTESIDPIVVHVKGGLLEVSRIQTVESFKATSDETILGIPVGKTVASIRVPAVYRYHVELAPDWKVILRDKTFIVVSPPVKPSLPTAIDTGKLEAESSGTWSPLTGSTRIAELQRSITKSLDAKAAAAGHVQLQREVARQTLKEFVAKWLVTQERWKDASSYEIRVFFADEPIQSLSALPQPFVGSL